MALRARGHDVERPKQPPQYVEMMDEHLADHESTQAAERRLARKQRQPSVRLRNKRRRLHVHRGLHRTADETRIEPLLDRAIVRAESPILVHHEANAAFDGVGKLDRLAKRRRERLLAENVRMTIGREPAKRHVRIEWSGDVERIRFACIEHPPRVVEYGPDSEFARTRLRFFAIRVADRNDVDVGKSRPAGKMQAAREAGARDGDAQWQTLD